MIGIDRPVDSNVAGFVRTQSATKRSVTTRGHRRQVGNGQLSPYSWKPEETHFAGPGVETTDGDLIHAGTVYHGHGLQPGGSFVVRRAVAVEEPTWVFRTDRKATDLDHDMETVHVAYDDGEIVGLGLRDGNVRWRRHLAVAGVPVVATALTVAEPGRPLIGTTDGRLLGCSTV
ncbi:MULTISPECIES: hypothetical protein [unclassified Streptomyces]|uniref:hypothetical protein n=1 Tax=unclassified Streptomyces TaxID=2593676 RepID=UPI0033348837